MVWRSVAAVFALAVLWGPCSARASWQCDDTTVIVLGEDSGDEASLRSVRSSSLRPASLEEKKEEPVREENIMPQPVIPPAGRLLEALDLEGIQKPRRVVSAPGDEEPACRDRGVQTVPVPLPPAAPWVSYDAVKAHHPWRSVLKPVAWGLGMLGAGSALAFASLEQAGAENNRSLWGVVSAGFTLASLWVFSRMCADEEKDAVRTAARLDGKTVRIRR